MPPVPPVTRATLPSSGAALIGPLRGAYRAQRADRRGLGRLHAGKADDDAERLGLVERLGPGGDACGGNAAARRGEQSQHVIPIPSSLSVPGPPAPAAGGRVCHAAFAVSSAG